jgi:hypothetical protein
MSKPSDNTLGVVAGVGLAVLLSPVLGRASDAVLNLGNSGSIVYLLVCAVGAVPVAIGLRLIATLLKRNPAAFASSAVMGALLATLVGILLRPGMFGSPNLVGACLATAWLLFCVRAAVHFVDRRGL